MIRYGLIGAGPVTEYLAAKLPGLKQELGAVAAANFRSASRIVNTLRAGVACEVHDLIHTPLILICAPGKHLEALTPVLEESSRVWDGKCVVLCNCRLFSRQMECLRNNGGSVASVREIPGMPGRYLVEGDRAALGGARHIVRELRGGAVQIPPEQHHLYSAALTFSNSLFTPLLEGCMQALRQAGVSGAMPGQMLEALFLNSLRLFLYSGRKSWTGPVATADLKAIDAERKALGKVHPNLDNLYQALAEAGSRLLLSKVPKRIRKRPAEKA